MTTLSLTADKSIIRGGEVVTFTAKYPGEVGKEIKLMQKALPFDVPVGNAITNNSGVAVISWRAPTAGTFHFSALHSLLPGFSDCGFMCDTSSEVSVTVTDAPCDPADILCNAGAGITSYRKDMELIIAVAVVIALLLIFFVYLPRGKHG